jgi:hypothetical protein
MEVEEVILRARCLGGKFESLKSERVRIKERLCVLEEDGCYMMIYGRV